MYSSTSSHNPVTLKFKRVECHGQRPMRPLLATPAPTSPSARCMFRLNTLQLTMLGEAATNLYNRGSYYRFLDISLLRPLSVAVADCGRLQVLPSCLTRNSQSSLLPPQPTRLPSPDSSRHQSALFSTTLVVIYPFFFLFNLPWALKHM